MLDKRMYKKRVVGKKGLSPVVTTILLVALVIIIALIIFFWLRGFIHEPITKFSKNIELSCKDVAFSASYSPGTIQITNNGNVPIYDFQVRITNKNKGYSEEFLRNETGSSWPKTGLNQGEAFSGTLAGASGATKIFLSPVLIGNTKEGRGKYICGDQYGQNIFT